MNNNHKNKPSGSGSRGRSSINNGHVEHERLRFDTGENSFTFDVNNGNRRYLHLDPYDSAAKNGNDSLSTFDESNIYGAAGEYESKDSLLTDLDKLGMHIAGNSLLELSAADKLLEHTPEDDRDDLDEEGYPKNDRIKR